jgi:hypothetical protein
LVILLITASAHGAKFATIVSIEAAQNPFIVHEELLKYHSPFFRAAFGGNFEESEIQKAQVEALAETVDLFVHWLYHQRLSDKQDDADLFKLWHLSEPDE